MNNWMTALFNMNGRRRNGRGWMWGTLLSLAFSLIAYGLRRNRNGNWLRPMQNVMNNVRMGSGQKPNMAGMTEFANEISPNKNPFSNK
ncbi:hypothetical protein [Fictibacillus barbaricus]|nr:hypothetical protein [Fictibacillus barbaricus]GGB47041.1 hypothetical protein GCM10007199_10630 [Fictibacillus barbaricus]